LLLFKYKKMKWTFHETKSRPAAIIGCNPGVILNRLFLFGGKNANNVVNSLCSLDLNTWNWKMETNGETPDQRMNYCCCTFGRKMFVLGGTNMDLSNLTYEERLSDEYLGNYLPNVLHELSVGEEDNIKWTTVTPKNPTPDLKGSLEGAVVASDNNFCLAFYCYPRLYQTTIKIHKNIVNDISWDSKGEADVNRPTPRINSSIAIVNNRALVFGGMINVNDRITYYNDTYAFKFDIDKEEIEKVSNSSENEVDIDVQVIDEEEPNYEIIPLKRSKSVDSEETSGSIEKQEPMIKIEGNNLKYDPNGIPIPPELPFLKKSKIIRKHCHT